MIARDFVLVLDDYHLIDARPIHDGITFLLDHLPRPMHLVITGRADPRCRWPVCARGENCPRSAPPTCDSRRTMRPGS